MVALINFQSPYKGPTDTHTVDNTCQRRSFVGPIHRHRIRDELPCTD